MDVDKSGSDTRVSYNDGESSPNGVELRTNPRFRGTEHDEQEMRTLGKTQQLNVR